MTLDRKKGLFRTFSPKKVVNPDTSTIYLIFSKILSSDAPETTFMVFLIKPLGKIEPVKAGVFTAFQLEKIDGCAYSQCIYNLCMTSMTSLRVKLILIFTAVVKFINFQYPFRFTRIILVNAQVMQGYAGHDDISNIMKSTLCFFKQR